MSVSCKSVYLSKNLNIFTNKKLTYLVVTNASKWIKRNSIFAFHPEDKYTFIITKLSKYSCAISS